MNETLPIPAPAEVATHAHSMWVQTPSGLHTSSCLDSRYGICGNPIMIRTIDHLSTIWIPPGYVEEVNTSKDDQKAAEQR